MSSDRKVHTNETSDLQRDMSDKSPTVEELLRMLSNSSNSKKPPPPVPPKPKHGIEMSIEAAKRSLGLIPGFRNIGKSNKTEARDVSVLNIGSEDNGPNVNTHMIILPKSDAEKGSSQIAGKRKAPNAKIPTGGCVVYESSAAPPITTAYLASKQNLVSDIYQQPLMTDSIPKASQRSRPIVTESPEEANNNVIRCPENTSTVQIHELPSTVAQFTRGVHGNTSVGGDEGNKTFYRLNQPKEPAHHTTRELVDSSSPTNAALDDDGIERSVGEHLKLSNKIDAGTMVNDSLDDQPPRTSTPTSIQYQIDNNSSSGASTATNNNRSSQNTYLSHGTRATSSDNSENDALNISRETDELTNTSIHNQSGCELVGLNDSDSRDNSPKKIKELEEQAVPTPYTVQMFNETLMSSTSSPIDQPEAKLLNKSAMSNHEIETNNLKTVVTTLQDEIQSLNSKVSSLSSKVYDLEYQLERQRKDLTLNKSASSIYANKDYQDGYSPSGSMQKGAYSRSVSTINKLTPMKSRHNNSSGQVSYSRNSMAAISPHTPAAQSQTFQRQLTSVTASPNNSKRVEAQQHINAIVCNMNTSMKRLNVYASTNSIYADGNKSGSSSISPTPLTPHNFQNGTSPSSYSSLSHRRDQSAYTSMLSLSSIGNSTLKKTSIAGSVSNLSQFGAPSQLSNWPSLSNYVRETHQAKDILYDDEEQVIRMVLYNNLITMRLPSWIGSDYNLDTIIDAPDAKLKLDWVHGYRGRDCRSNIYYLPTGECIYFVASIVILYNLREKTQRHYLGHTDSVKCLAIHPNKLIVASGQSASAERDKRPIVRVWNTVNLSTIRVIGFNEDLDRPICCLAFSKHDTGATLAVVDESSEHTITLLDWQREKNWRLAEVNSGHEPVLAIDFHPMDKYSLVAVGKSSVNFWDIRGMTLAKKAGLFDKYDRPKYVLCMTFNDLGETITGDSNGNVIIWPRGANKPRRIIRDAHPGGVFSVLAMKDGSYLTGGRDRRVVEWDEAFIPTGRQAELPEHCGGVRFITYARGSRVLIGTLRNSILEGSLDTEFVLIMQGHTEATTALAIHPTQPKYLTGGFDDQIFLIDVRTHEIEWIKCMAMPVTAACFSPDGRLLIIGSTQGKWSALDVVTQTVLFTACDGAGTINCVKFSPKGDCFCFGSSDCHIYVYQTNETGNTFKRIGTCVGHSAPVKEIDWSEDNDYVQSQSMNFELLFWRAHNCRPLDDNNIVHDLKWATHNCTIGFNVIGIWSDSIDSALINYCDKSNNDRLIVSATDTGYINVYNWPTYYNQCLSQKHYGNVDKFNFIKFLHDDSKLIGVGAKSCVTTEWSIEVMDEISD